MIQDKKENLQSALESLRLVLVQEGVSIGMNEKDRSLFIFDTDVYLETGKCDGIIVELDTLVN